MGLANTQRRSAPSDDSCAFGCCMAAIKSSAVRGPPALQMVAKIYAQEQLTVPLHASPHKARNADLTVLPPTPLPAGLHALDSNTPPSL